MQEIKNKGWRGKAERLQWFSNTKQLGAFYDKDRKLIGTINRTGVLLKSLDGIKLLTNRQDRHKLDDVTS